MQQPIPPQLEVAAAAAQGPDAGMGRTASVRQPLDDTHGCCGHGAGAQEVAGGDRACHAPLQLPHARRSKMPTSHLRAMRLHVAAVASPHSTPLPQPAAAALQTLMGAVSIWNRDAVGWGGGEGVIEAGPGPSGSSWTGSVGWLDGLGAGCRIARAHTYVCVCIYISVPCLN